MNQRPRKPSNDSADFDRLHSDVIACGRCPRLRDHCQAMAVKKRAAFMDWDYWGLPVPGFGDPAARLWILGLAPAAHGGNRTGRIFTGDRSGDFLFRALHRAGYANQPTSVRRDDGLRLKDCYISPAVRCAPPDNKPLPQEIRNCADYLDREWELLTAKRVILALGRIAWDAALALARRNLPDAPPARSAFAHAREHLLAPKLVLIGSYHVSQQNTFTGRLTPDMFEAILQRARQLSGA